MSQFVIDHHLIDSLNIFGILLGAFGLFYITYEFFGRKPLKQFIRVITPGLIGALILALAGVVQYSYLVGYRGQILRGGALYALVGGMIGIFNGIFVDWPPSPDKPRLFSWKGCLIGLGIAFFIWFVAALVLGLTPTTALLEAGILAPTGAVAGSFWHFFNWIPFYSPSAEKSPSFSWKGALIGLISAFLFGFAADLLLGGVLGSALREGSFLTLTGGIAGGFWRFFRGEPLPSLEIPPLFSWKGCLIGLISAFLFGFVSAFVVDITFGTLLASLRGALTAAAFIGPAGAITGGISRFIFWRANGLGDGKLGGIGALMTLAGFLFQLLPPIISLLNIPVR